MTSPSDKIMFEIYREAGYDRRYRVVYFTELNEHNKEGEIARAMEGDHFYDSFLKDASIREAKKELAHILRRLNDGEPLTTVQLEQELRPFLAS